MRRLLIVLVAFSLMPIGLTAGQPDTAYVAWWNVENLFDNVDDPYEGDDEFTAASDKRWTDKRVDAKFVGLSRVLASMNDGQGPDLLGLAEVEHRSVLETWVQNYLQKFGYGIAYHESPDLRSIDLAVLYRKSIFEHIATRGHAIDLGSGNRPTRDVTVYSLVSDGDTLDCVLVHWPSRYGGKEQSEPKRITAAKVTSGAIDSLYRIRRNDDVILMGDFNDTPGDVSITRYLHARDVPPSAVDGDKPYLFNTMMQVHENPAMGSYYYRGDWNTLDQILLTSGLFNQTGFGTGNPVGDVFVLPFMREQEGRYKDAPYRTYVGPRYLGGISDHFPVFIQLEHYNSNRE